MKKIELLNQKKFEEHLKTIRKLSDSSIAKYARQAHNRILKDLGISFYDIESMNELHQLLLDVKNLEKHMEKDPKRMYSAAVSNYIKFNAYQNEYAYLVEEASYLYLVEKELTTKLQDHTRDKTIHPSPPAELRANSTQIYQRSRRVAAEAIQNSNYLCQIDSNHAFFKSRTTKKNYVEAHHIIPISTQALFEYSIDCVPNIASLCPVCHRQIHYGYSEDRTKLLEVLWDKQYRKIEKAGIELRFKEVVEMY